MKYLAIVLLLAGMAVADRNTSKPAVHRQQVQAEYQQNLRDYNNCTGPRFEDGSCVTKEANHANLR